MWGEMHAPTLGSDGRDHSRQGRTRSDPSSLPQTAEHDRVARPPPPKKGRDRLHLRRRSADESTANAQGARLESGEERLSDPETGVVPGVTRDRNMRSRSRCSMCPAIHINSRSCCALHRHTSRVIHRLELYLSVPVKGGIKV